MAKNLPLDIVLSTFKEKYGEIPLKIFIPTNNDIKENFTFIS